MAISQVGVATGTSYNGDSQHWTNAAFPAGVQAGDVLVAYFCTNNQGSILTGGSPGLVGWTQIGTVQDTTTDSTGACAYRVAQGAETVWGFEDLWAAGESGHVVITAWRGVDLNNPINTSAQTDHGTVTTATSPLITTTLANCLVLQFVGTDPGTGAYAASVSGSPGGTELYDSKNSTGSLSYIAIQSYLRAGFGPTQVAMTVTSDGYHGRAVALQPAAPSSGDLSVTERGDRITAAAYIDTPLDSYGVTPQLTVGEVGVAADLAVTERGDYATATAAVTVTAAAAIAEQGDRVESAAAVGVIVASAILERGDTLEATYTLQSVIVADLAAIERGDQLSATAGVTVTAAGAASEQRDTVSGNAYVDTPLDAYAVTPELEVGTAERTADLAVTERGDRLDAAVAVGVVATAALLERGDRLGADGSIAGIEAAFSVTERGDRVDASAAVTVSSAAQLIERGDIVVSDASVTGGGHNPGHISRLGQFGIGLKPYAGFAPKSVQGINASAAITEQGDRVASTATVGVTATSAILERGDHLAGSAGVTVGAAAALSELRDQVSATASIAGIEAALAVTERGDRVAASASVGIGAAAELVERGDIVVSSAAVLVQAAAAILEQRDQVAASAFTSTITASLAVTERGDSLAASVEIGVRQRYEIAATDALPNAVTATDEAVTAIAATDGNRTSISTGESLS